MLTIRAKGKKLRSTTKAQIELMVTLNFSAKDRKVNCQMIEELPRQLRLGAVSETTRTLLSRLSNCQYEIFPTPSFLA